MINAFSRRLCACRPHSKDLARPPRGHRKGARCQLTAQQHSFTKRTGPYSPRPPVAEDSSAQHAPTGTHTVAWMCNSPQLTPCFCAMQTTCRSTHRLTTSEHAATACPEAATCRLLCITAAPAVRVVQTLVMVCQSCAEAYYGCPLQLHYMLKPTNDYRNAHTIHSQTIVLHPPAPVFYCTCQVAACC
jgi:hypothetical protein